MFVNETRGGKAFGSLWLKEEGKALQILTVIMTVLAKDPVISRLPLVTNFSILYIIHFELIGFFSLSKDWELPNGCDFAFTELP